MVDFDAMSTATDLINEIEKNLNDYNKAHISSDDYDVLKKALRIKLYRYVSKANELDDFGGARQSVYTTCKTGGEA